MNQAFRVKAGFTVPDGTMVFPFLNSKDSTCDLPWALVDNVSLAVGDIAPHTRSKIHIHPIVTLITWVVSGSLNIRMQEPASGSSYTVHLSPQQAAIARPRTFLQHINTTNDLCRVLYIVSPAFLFVQKEAGFEGYDDALVIELEWEELADEARRNSVLERFKNAAAERQRAAAFLEAKKKG